jgi:hypothetical protein
MLSPEQVTHWLKWFGYIASEDASEAEQTMAIAAMQKVYGLTIDGDAGPITRSAMKLFRCSRPDRAMLHATNTRAVTTPLDTCRWRKTEVTFAIAKSFRLGGDVNECRRIIRYGFKLYEPLTGLRFAEISSTTRADIVVSQGASKKDEFDGPGNVLAWAEMPCGDDHGQLRVKFDESEPWNLKSSGPGIILISVWLHELGHLLGLDHSPNAADLMAPFYNAQIQEPQSNDVARLAALYNVTAPPPKLPPTAPSVPGLPYGLYSIAGTMVLRDDGGVALSLDKVSPK